MPTVSRRRPWGRGAGWPGTAPAYRDTRSRGQWLSNVHHGLCFKCRQVLEEQEAAAMGGGGMWVCNLGMGELGGAKTRGTCTWG